MNETRIESATESVLAPTLNFENGGRAEIVRAGSKPQAVELLAQLGLRPGRPVLVVGGGAGTLTGDEYELASRVVGPAVARAAELTGAAVVDGGTAVGIMAIVGEAIRERRDDGVVLLGVAPAGCVIYPGSSTSATGDEAALEPNHSHFILADSAEWGGETEVLIGHADALAAGKPIVMVVAGGGSGTAGEALHAAGRGWPVFVVVRTGGVADVLAAAWQRTFERQPRRFARRIPERLARRLPRKLLSRMPAGNDSVERVVREILRDSELRDQLDPAELAKVVRDGDFRLYEGRDPCELTRELAWELQDEDMLKLAWKSFATYDGLAGAARSGFERIQASILVGGIVATFVALLTNAIDVSPTSSVWWIEDVLHWTVVVLPILVAVLVGMAHRLASGKRWVLLRGAAETIKREIYRFRTGTGIYGEASVRGSSATPEKRFAAELDAIETKLLQTEASSAELTPYDGPLPPKMYGASGEDDGLSPLDAERYLALRIGDQLDYYHPKVAALARTRRRFQFAVVAAAGAGTILAVAGFEVWIGLTTGIAAAALAYLGYLQVESTVVVYNQSAAKLEALRRRWRALSPEEREDPAAFAALVDDAEAVLETELGGWVHQMNEALEKQQATEREEQRQAGFNTTSDSSVGSGRGFEEPPPQSDDTVTLQEKGQLDTESRRSAG